MQQRCQVSRFGAIQAGRLGVDNLADIAGSDSSRMQNAATCVKVLTDVCELVRG